MNFKSNKQGFTIVELLIVIVVIGILAAITIVAYNGIQNRSKTAAAQSAANTVIKKAEAANSIASSYPTVAGTGTAAGTFGANNESSMSGTGIALVADITAAPTAPATVQYIACSGTGAKVTYWDYSTGSGAKAAYQYLGTATAANCAATTGGLVAAF